MRDFRELTVWQKSHRLSLALYKVTASFPKEEIFGLTSQMRRCCVSIEANVAEGCGRGGDADFARFMQIAFGSANELDCQLLLARDLGYLTEANFAKLSNDLSEVKRMLAAFLKKLRANR